GAANVTRLSSNATMRATETAVHERMVVLPRKTILARDSELPVLGNPAVRRRGLTRGFASPSRDGFAFSRRGLPRFAGRCMGGARVALRRAASIKIWKSRGPPAGVRQRPADAP